MLSILNRDHNGGAVSSSTLFPNVARVYLLSLSLLLLASPVHAQLTTLTVGQGVEQRRIALEPMTVDDRAYVSLSALMEGLGGAYNLLPARVRVDYNATTAWLRVDDRRVDALSIFSLAYPIRELDTDVYIALQDVGHFFLKAFRAELSLSGPALTDGEPAETPEPSESEPDSRTTLSSLPVARPVNVIVIDAGHGGYDSGLVGAGGYQEKVLCLDVALRLKAFLEDSIGQTIVLTRGEDSGLSTQDRILVATENEGELFITIHAGGAMTPRSSGITVLYRPLDSLGAPLLNSRLSFSGTGGGPIEIGHPSRSLARSIAEALSDSTATRIRGVHAAPVRLLQRAEMPSVMVEVGHLTNSAEEALLQTQDYRERIARGIADGLLAYLNATGASTPAGNLDTGLSGGH